MVTLVGGLAASMLFSAWFSSEEHKEETRFLERVADMRVNVFRNELQEALAALSTVNQLFATVDGVTPQQFRAFSEPLLDRHPYLHAFAFQRTAAADAGMRSQSAAATEFWSGRPVDAQATGRIVDHIGALRGNAAVFDAGTTAPALEQAVDAITAAGTSATGLFRLQDTEAQPGFVVVTPAYRQGALAAQATEQSTALLGYTAALVRAGDLAEYTLVRTGLFDDYGITMHVQNGTPTGPNLVFRSNGAVAPSKPSAFLPQWPFERQSSSVTRSFDAAGLKWQMVVTSAPGFLGNSHASAWIALVAGSLSTLLAAAYLQSLTRRAAELARANALLSEDIAARERVERALRESEERFHRLADLSSDWYWEQDAQLRLTKVSGEKIVDIATNQLIGKALWELPFEATEVDWAAHKKLVQARQPFTDIEYKVQEDNGRIHWIVVNGEPLFDMYGVFIGYRGTAKDLTARKEAELALRQSQQELRELSAHQERVKEDERKRIAREIHDDLGQNLLALRIDVTMLDADTAQAHPELNRKIRAVLAQIDTTMKSIRAIINNLRPSVLDLGLQAAIEWQVQQFRQRNGIPCRLIIEQDDFDAILDEESATSVFRIVQESLTNIARHAHASRAEITMRRDGNMLVIAIGDDGVGTFPGNQRKPRSFGLIGIRERIHRMNGLFVVDSLPGQGTLLTISIPVSDSRAAAAA